MKSSASELGLRKHQQNKSRICDAQTIVENLHAASHFRHETFSVLQYAIWNYLKGVTETDNKVES